MTVLVLCADDFALTEGVSRGILRLAEAGRLSAISAMSASPHWRSHAPALAALPGEIDLGLHLTLTHLAPLGPMPKLVPPGDGPRLDRLIGLAYGGLLDLGELSAEVERQVAAFETALGRPPDFIDGHQHVHVLPVVRNAILGLFDRGRLDRGRTYVRSCFEPVSAILRRSVSPAKALSLSALARPLAAELGGKGIAANDSFRGVNGFRLGEPVRPMFRRFLQGPGRRPLLMCHPGLLDPSPIDPIASRRVEELSYLASDDLLEDLAAAGVSLSRLPPLSSSAKAEDRQWENSRRRGGCL